MIKKLLLCAAMAAPLCMNAADVYVTPQGNGTKDGTTWENAMGLDEYNALMKFKSVSDATGKFDETTIKFAAGEYIIASTSFVYRSGITVDGSYDPTTGQKSTTARTIFNGNNKERSNGAFFLQPESKMDGTNGTRKISISGIDFENFICNNVWRNGDTNWQYGLPSTIYITQCGEAYITDCKFNGNKCTATGTFTNENNNKSTDPKEMAGAITVNRGNIFLSNCSFTANEGTQGGAVKMFYNVGGTVTKDLYITIDRCLFSGNKTSDSGAAIMGRNTEQVNIINSTFYGNEASKGGAVYMNAPGFYSNKLNVVSCTIAGNSAPTGPEIYTNGNGVINMANSIVVANTEAEPIADLSSTAGYKFLGYNVVGPIAEGYTTSDDEPTDPAAMVMSSADDNSNSISAENTYASVFGTNTLEANGTLCPIVAHSGMPAAELTALVESQKWPYAVDAAVDQLGQPRTDKTSVGAGAFDTNVTAVETIAPNATETDSNWYTIQGMRLNGEPTTPGIYIHAGKKIIVR